jgi:hypothetical protein
MLQANPEISVVTNQFLFSPKQLQIQQTITLCQLVVPLSYTMPTTEQWTNTLRPSATG